MMGHHKQREEYWGNDAPAAAPKPRPPAAPETVKAAEEPAAEIPDAIVESQDVEKNVPPALKDLSTESISDTFKKLAADARAAQEVFRPTLAALHALVARCQESGMDQVGFEQAGFDTLRHFNLKKDGANKTDAVGDVHFGILSIDDARLLVRIHPENIIDIYNENINKPQALVTYLDDRDFWNGGKNDNKFARYDLADDEDRISLTYRILQTAAATGALQEMRAFDLPAQNSTPVGKTHRKQMKPL